VTNITIKANPSVAACGSLDYCQAKSEDSMHEPVDSIDTQYKQTLEDEWYVAINVSNFRANNQRR